MVTINPTTITLGNPSNGSLTNHGNGTVTYTPNANYHGNDSFTYTVRDSQNVISNVATVSLVVSAVNDAPTVATIIADQSATEAEAFNFTFAGNTFDDIDGDTLTYSATLADGSALPSWLSFDAQTRTFSGTPDAADVGTISVKVAANDGSLSVDDSFDINVAAVPTDPEGPTGAGVIMGTEGNDTINSSWPNDVINALGGDDTINSSHGNDEVWGGTGNDTIDGGTGNDEIYGGAGNDTIDGNSGNDEIYGGSGNDVLDGGFNIDTLHGRCRCRSINRGVFSRYILV